MRFQLNYEYRVMSLSGLRGGILTIVCKIISIMLPDLTTATMRGTRHCRKIWRVTANAKTRGLEHHLPRSLVSTSEITNRLSSDTKYDGFLSCSLHQLALKFSSSKSKRVEIISKKSTSVYRKLSGLKILYECVEDFLRLRLIQQTLSNEQHKERAEEVLSGSVLLLDVCSNTRECFSSMKESLQKLESSFRRRKGGESSLASEVEAFMTSRKQLNKSICKRFRTFKTMEKNASNIPNAIAILTEVREISLEIFQSLLSLVSQPKARSSSHGWSVVSKSFKSKRVSCEAELNELEKIDAELLVLKSNKGISPSQVQNLLKGLEALESNIQEAEEELGAVYRKLLKNRINTSTSKFTFHLRSSSLPSKNHPLTEGFEEQLSRLRESESTSSSVSYKVSALKDLHDSVDDLLHFPLVQQALSNEHYSKCIEESLERSIRLLDVCGTTRDVFSQMKECVQGLPLEENMWRIQMLGK
ncbi:hypothetical protein SADUNF_Sadunf05G0189600 [Salix dunnii]|uniref:Uncharacterized protein n=1 Tax=Salix dunnii TaxID=1413687 RepID=A0A835KC84_9ROSI|nr:hypothetical protein SADUNF_Sadunf05G0189600 [Salix dunnii]